MVKHVTLKRAADCRKTYIRELRTFELGDINNRTVDKITNKCIFLSSKVIDCNNGLSLAL
jgi:hypothetical protein